MKLKYAYGSAPGSPSAEQKTKCQGRIKITDENGVTVISLSDPAGTAEKSDAYPEFAAEAARVLMAERFDELYISEDDYIKKSIRDTILKALQSQGMETPGMEGDLLVVAVKDGRYLAGHMGGGLIARLNGSCSVLSRPNSCLFRKETDSTMEDRVMAELRIYKGDVKEPFGFMLLSSGACQSLYDDSTGNLSSACDTFFQWLKEYDEETVSEALTDNINKYFLKDTTEDINVAIMLSEEEEKEPHSVLPKISESNSEQGTSKTMQEKKSYKGGNGAAKRHSKNKDLKYIIIAMLIILIIIISKLIQPGVIEPEQEGKTGSNPPVPPVTYSENYEPTVTFSVENPESFDPGEYEVGVDLPAGEYFFWTGDMLKPDSVVVNGDTCLSDELYCMTIRVNEGDIMTSEYRFTAAENVNPVKSTKGILISGKYKIGKDIVPGEYKVSPITENAGGRYYSIFDEEINNEKEFNGETTVEVPEEGYVVIYNSALVVEQ